MAGRIRKKLALLLAEHFGETVDPDEIWEQPLWYRNHRFDLARWGCRIYKANGALLIIASWDTMSDCVKFGIDALQDTRYHNSYEVSQGNG